MERALSTPLGSVEAFPGAEKNTVVLDELNKILSLLRDACPSDALISFDFDGTLHAHIDVRNGKRLRSSKPCCRRWGWGCSTISFEAVRRTIPSFTGSACWLINNPVRSAARQ